MYYNYIKNIITLICFEKISTMEMLCITSVSILLSNEIISVINICRVWHWFSDYKPRGINFHSVHAWRLDNTRLISVITRQDRASCYSVRVCNIDVCADINDCNLNLKLDQEIFFLLIIKLQASNIFNHIDVISFCLFEH